MEEDNVYELTEWRAARRPERIPAEVMAEVELAGRLCAALAAQGFHITFEHEGEGRVRAQLRSDDGTQTRPVSLMEVIGADELPGPGAGPDAPGPAVA